LAAKYNKRKQEKAQLKDRLLKKEANRKMLKQFVPLVIAVLLWFITLLLLHLPSIKNDIGYFFVKFTLDSAIMFGKLLFVPMQSTSFPFITVDGYTMQIVMECTA